jgi:hypothetical protein
MSEFKDRCHYFYANAGGTDTLYNWPNSAEGDLLKIGLREITDLEAALRSLIALRAHKKIRGKDAHYRANNPAAWEQAINAINPPKEVDDG